MASEKKGALECETEGCTLPAQHFPVDVLPEDEAAGAASVTKNRLSNPHKFCTKHYREWETGGRE